jgi:Tol biopolymer transport system component
MRPVRWVWKGGSVLAVTASCAAPEPSLVGSRMTPELPPLQTVRVTDDAAPAGARTLTFHSDREGRHRLYTVDLRTNRVNRLTDGHDHHDEEPVWSPDGTALAFSTTRFDHTTFDLATLDRRTGHITRVTDHAAFERHPAWTPDGQRLLYTTDQEGLEAVFERSLVASTPARVSPAGRRGRSPATASTGRLAFIDGSSDGLRVVVLMDGERRVVSPATVDADDPRLNPGGDRLAYAALSDAGAEIHLVNLTTGHLERIGLQGHRSVREPAWSPDGRFLALTGTRGRGPNADWDLYVLRLEEPRVAFRVTSGPRSDRAPAWGPP